MSYWNTWGIDLKSKKEFNKQEYEDIIKDINNISAEKLLSSDAGWLLKDVLDCMSHAKNKLDIDSGERYGERVEGPGHYYGDALDKIIKEITKFVPGGWEPKGKYVWGMDDGNFDGDMIWEVEDDGISFYYSEEEYEIDIGSHVGVEVDGEEFFGEVIEFDNEEDTVTIEDEDSGEEIIASKETMYKS